MTPRFDARPRVNPQARDLKIQRSSQLFEIMLDLLIIINIVGSRDNARLASPRIASQCKAFAVVREMHDSAGSRTYRCSAEGDRRKIFSLWILLNQKKQLCNLFAGRRKSFVTWRGVDGEKKLFLLVTVFVSQLKFVGICAGPQGPRHLGIVDFKGWFVEAFQLRALTPVYLR